MYIYLCVHIFFHKRANTWDTSWDMSECVSTCAGLDANDACAIIETVRQEADLTAASRTHAGCVLVCVLHCNPFPSTALSTSWWLCVCARVGMWQWLVVSWILCCLWRYKLWSYDGLVPRIGFMISCVFRTQQCFWSIPNRFLLFIGVRLLV